MKTKLTAAVLAVSALLLLSACADNTEVPQPTETVPTTVTETVTTVTTEETTVTTEVTTTEQYTEVTTETPWTEAPWTEPPYTEPQYTEPVYTEPPVTTTQAPVTEPVPVNGTTANGHTLTTVNGVTYVDGILVANKTYSLPDSYNPGGITDEAFAAFAKMQSDAAAQGISLFVKSGFRSYYDQAYIYANYAAADGYAAADTYSARAGHSEHQSGLAMDLNSLYTSFGDTAEGIWLRDNCHKYGFIIRYPAGKESVTGYMYEPWHVRYVGEDVAAAIYGSGLCFEEYFGITSCYS